MLRPRIIPCLLIQDGGLVKTRQFKDPKYVGDPINAVKIFNEKSADEIMIVDIDATAKGQEPDFKRIRDIAAECRMPMTYGGGVRTLGDAQRIIGLGVEKIALSSEALANPELVSEIARSLGSQSVVAVLDVKKTGLINKSYNVFTHNGKRAFKGEIFSVIDRLQDAGIGELVVNFIERDGMMEGYDVDFASRVARHVTVPVTFLGGAGSLDDIRDLLAGTGIVGASAGSLFVFKGRYRAVLINYPDFATKARIAVELHRDR